MAKKAFILVKEEGGVVCTVRTGQSSSGQPLATFQQAEDARRELQRRYPDKQYTIYMVVPITQRALTPFDPIDPIPEDAWTTPEPRGSRIRDISEPPERPDQPTEQEGGFAERVREIVGTAEPVETSH